MITPSTNLERDILSALFEFPGDASFTRLLPVPSFVLRLLDKADQPTWLPRSHRMMLSLSPSSQLLTLSRKTRVVEDDWKEEKKKRRKERKKGLRKRRPRARTMPTKRDRTDDPDDNAENDNFARLFHCWLSHPV